MFRPRFLRISAHALLGLALGVSLKAAPKTVKEHGGEANNGNTYVEGSAPGNSDTVKIDGNNKKVTLTDLETEWGAVEFTAGALEGKKKLSLTLTTSFWTGGVIDGATLSTPGITIGAGSEKKLQGGGQLEVKIGGTATWSGDDLVTGGGAEIKNSGTFTTNFGGKITKLSGESSKFTNSGSFVKETAATTTEIQASFDSKDAGSSVTVNGGTLRFAGGGESSKTVTLGNATKLEIAGSDYVFSGGTLNASGSGSIDVASAIATFGGTTGSANLAVNGGTARVNGSHATSGRLKLSSGKLDATATSGTASVGGFDWTGGDVSGVIVNSADTTISGSGTKKLIGSARLNLSGTTTWSADTIGTGDSAEITNTGAFTTSFDGTLAHNQGGTRATFKNAGTFTKSNSTAGTTEIQASFENIETGASVAVDGGTLKLSGGGSSNKGISLASGTTLQIAGNEFSIAGGAITGGGKLELASSKTIFSNTTSNAGELAITGGTAQFDGAHTGSGKLSLLAGGSVTGAGTASFGSLDWKGGQVNGKVSTTGNASLSGSDAKTIGSSGELSLSANESRSWSGGTIANQGKLTLASGTTDVQAEFSNSGSLETNNGGVVKLRGGGTSSNAVTVGANSKLELSTTNFAFTGGVLNSDATGGIEVTGATTSFSGTTGSANLTVTSSGTVNFAGAHSTTGKLKLDAGTIQGSGQAEVGAFDFNTGSLNGKVRSTGATQLSGDNKSISGGELVIAGTADFAGGTVTLSNNAKIKTEAGKAFRVNADGTFANSNGASFENAGSFEKLGGTGSTVLETLFENSGTISVASGKLKLSQGASNADNSKLEVAAGAELEFNGNVTLPAKSELKGNGKARFLANGFTLLINALVEVASFDFDDGTLAGSNRFGGVLNWNGGDWNSAGHTTIAQGAVLNLNKHTSHEFNGRSLVNEGTINWYAGNIRAGNGSAFTNEAVFNDLNGGTKSILAPGGFGGTFTFTNNGLYKKTTGGTTTIEIPFVNNGSMEIAAGSIVFAGTFTNHGSVQMKNGASANFSAPLSFTASQPLSGTGVIDAPQVIAAGLVSPGTSPGLLTITGGLTLLGTSELLIELASPTQGSGYDFMNVGGSADLGGSQLKLTLLSGFGASILPTDTFTVLTAGSTLSGTFGNIANGQRLFMLDGIGSFQVNYGLGSTFAVNSVVLSNFSAVPEPSTWALLIAGVAMVAFQVRRRRQ